METRGEIVVYLVTPSLLIAARERRKKSTYKTGSKVKVDRQPVTLEFHTRADYRQQKGILSAEHDEDKT